MKACYSCGHFKRLFNEGSVPSRCRACIAAGRVLSIEEMYKATHNDEKMCIHCREVKNRSEFYPVRKDRPWRLYSLCKPCTNLVRRMYPKHGNRPKRTEV